MLRDDFSERINRVIRGFAVLPFVYSYTCNSTLYVTRVKVIVLRNLYTHACRYRRAAWGCTVTHLGDQRSCEPSVESESYLPLNFTFDYAVTLDQSVSGTRRPAITWRVRRQQWRLISLLFLVCEERGSTMVKVLCYKLEVAGSIPDSVIGIFH